MIVELNTFKRNNKPIGRRSKLDGFTNEIMDLYHGQYSLDQILAFLELNEVTITKPSLSRFIKKSLVSSSQASKQGAVKVCNLQAEKVPTAGSVVTKFDWQNKIDPNDLF